MDFADMIGVLDEGDMGQRITLNDVQYIIRDHGSIRYCDETGKILGNVVELSWTNLNADWRYYGIKK
jgi:hypothetical protein